MLIWSNPMWNCPVVVVVVHGYTPLKLQFLSISVQTHSSLLTWCNDTHLRLSIDRTKELVGTFIVLKWLLWEALKLDASHIGSNWPVCKVLSELVYEVYESEHVRPCIQGLTLPLLGHGDFCLPFVQQDFSSKCSWDIVFITQMCCWKRFGDWTWSWQSESR